MKNKKPIDKECVISFSLVFFITTVFVTHTIMTLPLPLGGTERAYQQAQAFILAKNLVKDYSGNGKCLIIHHPTSVSGKANINRLINEFRLGFGDKINEIKAAPIKILPKSDDDTFIDEAMMEVTAADFNKVIQENKDCDIVIIMVSLPFGEDELYSMDMFKLIDDEDNPGKWVKDPNAHYPTVGVYNGYPGNLAPFFEEGLIHGMSIWNPNPEIDGNPAPEDKQIAFDKRYLLISPENIAAVKETHPKLFPRRNKK